MQKEEELYIYGKNPVFEYIKKKPERVNRIFVKSDASPKLFKDLKAVLTTTKIQISSVPIRRLNKMAGKDAHHQGIVAEISPVEYLDLVDWLRTNQEKEQLSLLVLDSITDPHNFGAMLRTAAASEIDAVLIGTRDQVSVNGTVIKTSSGLAEELPIIRVNNLNQALRALKAEDFFVYGSSMNTEKSYVDWQPAKKSIILIGSEGFGIRRSALELCDEVLYIPMNQKVESLNASVSASLLMYEWRRKMSK